MNAATTLQRLIWLKQFLGGGGAPIEWSTVTGTPPLSLPNALAYALKHLIQDGYLTQSATPTPSAPIDLVCNNGALRWGALGKNLANPEFYKGYGWYPGTGDKVTNISNNGTIVVPCKPNTTYSWWHTVGKGGMRAFELDTNTVTEGQYATWAVSNPTYTDEMIVTRYTTSASAKLLCVLFARVNSAVGRTIDEQLADFMLVEGDVSTATAYEPYRGGIYADGTPEVITLNSHTAHAENLLAVGTYADIQDIVSGHVTRRCAVKVFDGTENWVLAANGEYFTLDNEFNDCVYYSASNPAVHCSHFRGRTPNTTTTNMVDGDIKLGYSTYPRRLYLKYTSMTTVDALEAYLADQYAQGTPVIVVYPLATEVSETVAAQTMKTASGSNTLTANVGAQFSVIYAKEGG